MEMQEKPYNNIIRSIIDILKLFYWKIWYIYIYIYDIICNIRYNYIMLIYKKC